MTIDNPQAFPATCLNDPCHPESRPGMSLRDYFAGQALTELVKLWAPEEAADSAYIYADAMLAARATTASKEGE
jgi:hypothetical protein